MSKNFTRKTSWLWQNAEKMLIILFFATFTFNVRKVFLTPYSFLNGTFNEYLTMSFSWADALMFTVILIYTIKWLYSQMRRLSSADIIANNNINNKSSVLHRITNVPRETYFLLFFIVWCFISIIWSQYKPIAIYRCVTLLEVFLFFAIAYKNLVTNDRLLRLSFIALIINGFIQSIIAIFQFIYGHSFGLRFLGESIVSHETIGVAKIMINGAKHIRAYGTFPHPNILAGFLILPLVILSMSLIAKWRSKRYQTNLLSDEENKSKTVSHATILSQVPVIINFIILIVIGLVFVLTFSRSAFIGFFIIMLFIFSKIIQGSKYKLMILISVLFIIIILFVFMYSINRSTSLFSDQSIKERVSYVNVSREIISKHPLLGVGMGQFVQNEYKNNNMLEGWQYQPVHNVYLLVSSELGIIGLTLFLIFIITLLFGPYRGCNTSLLLTNNILYAIIYSLLAIAIFDHYFWDIKIGIVVFALPILFLKISNFSKA